MAHYALLNNKNIVTQVIVGYDENDAIEGINDFETYYASIYNQKCLRTSYNTLAGQHLTNGQPFRKNYAGIGYSYDETLDAFIAPKPFDSWLLDVETCVWEPPIPKPDNENMYSWNEVDQTWEISND